jgi:hypothetical protein
MTTSPSSIFRHYRRAWCADQCGRRILITVWHRTHGDVCMPCYVKAVEQSERDEEMRSLKGYTDEELERI